LFEALFKYPRDDYARSELIFAGDWPIPALGLLVAIAFLGISFLLYRRRAMASATQLAAVGMLQLAMLGVILWVLLQPTLRTEQLRAGENTIALVLDTSASMAYGDSEDRLRVAARGLEEVAEGNTSLNLEMQRFEFGESATAVPSFAASEATRPATSIADSLLAVLQGARFNPLAAVILSSDGADTDGGLSTDELREIAAFGVPVHTIAVGRSVIEEDVELASVSLPRKVLPGSTLSARVAIRHDGPGSTQVSVFDGDDLLALETVQLPAAPGTSHATIDVELPEAGHHQLRFEVAGGNRETELRNNSRSTLVEVANESYRILYYEGEPRWEYKFLRRALGADEDLHLVTLLRVSPNKFYRQGIDTTEQLENGFPTTRDELFSYDALLIGSVEAASLTIGQQTLIRDFVSERGGSLLMLAGPSGLGNGGWGQSGIADVLPALLAPSTSNTFFRKRAFVELTAQGADAQMLRFADTVDTNREAWASLPEIADYQLTGNLKPAAVTLLAARTDVGRQPLLLTQPFGRGHSYILATGGTWRWQMSMPVEDQSHETFWRQLLRSLVANVPENISLSADFAHGAGNVALRAEFRDDAFRPLEGIGATVVASHESGASWSVALQASAAEEGVFTGEFVPDRSGSWYFEAVAESEGEPVAVSRAGVHYESGQAEHFNIRSNPTLLRNLSEATGGQFFAAGNLAALPDLLRYSSSGITEQQYRPVWDAPAVFLLLLLLKAGEWLLRRRWSTI
jgi:uncharacterized membrane protein